jgi:hypothetical protein
MPSRASAPHMIVPMLPAPPVTTATPRSFRAFVCETFLREEFIA